MLAFKHLKASRIFKCRMSEPEKPKRGRKPKSASDEKPAPAEKGKRGRKPRVVYNSFENEQVQSMSEDENIIMKLNVAKDESDCDTQDDYDAYNDTTASAYCDANFVCINSLQTESNKYEDQMSDQSKLKVIELLKDFEEKNKNNEWPQSTTIHCYWCCHRFETPPFGIPIKYCECENKFHVYGCFCSLECAAAYNMSTKESMDEIWERYNLINLLSRRIGHKQIIKPAPNRLSLKMFGGHLSIQEFRTFCNTTKMLNINFPPMMTMTQQIEEINDSDINSEYKYIPIDTERINKYKEKIKIKRSKPLTDFKNTLDHAMNLKFGN